MIPDHRYWTPTIESGISAGAHKHLSCRLIVRKRPDEDGLVWEAIFQEGVEGLRAGLAPDEATALTAAHAWVSYHVRPS